MSDTRDKILQLLLGIAPEASDENIDPDMDLREQLDIDSMDQLHFLIAVSKAFGIDIPEQDYPELMTLDACARYVEEHSGG